MHDRAGDYVGTIELAAHFLYDPTPALLELGRVELWGRGATDRKGDLPPLDGFLADVQRTDAFDALIRHGRPARAAVSFSDPGRIGD